MKPRPPLPPAPYLVVGLARSGVAAALALRRADPEASILACDRGRPAEATEAGERLTRAGVEVHLETDGTELLLVSQPPRTLVKSPGVPRQAPVVARAREAGLEIVGELELGWRLVANAFCAVTGTNGKTTTVELLGAIHREAGRPVAVAGNVGNPVSAFAGSLSPDATVVCEASSFQLEDSEHFAPETAVFLNFADDHLDRHDDREQYLEAKLRAFANQTGDDVAVLNASETALAGREVPGNARRVWFGLRDDCELRLDDGHLLWQQEPLLAASELRLPGAHNLENAMAAAAATLASGIEAEAVRSALRGFAGVPHRLERVAEIDGVVLVNDSKATNPAAAVAALESFEGGVHAILGGSLKGGDFSSLAPAVSQRCAGCYLIGEAAERLSQELMRTGVELHECGDLERAVSEAADRARPGQTILLSPACASFDQYADYEERGEHFRSLVEALRGRNGRAGS
jgi:UDP-N-acetylmuramoylalanine--D-glutamate ligase